MEILGEHKILLLHRAIPFVWKLREITAEQQVQGYLLTDTDGLPFPSTTELSKTTKLWSCGQKWRCSVFWTLTGRGQLLACNSFTLESCSPKLYCS